MIHSDLQSYNFKAIMEELIPPLIKDSLTVATPYLLWLGEILPTGLAIVAGVIGVLHIWKKYRLASIELDEKLKSKKDEVK